MLTLVLVTGIFRFKKETVASNLSTSLPPHAHGCDDLGVHEVCERYVSTLTN